jgi:DNA helicase HerA-like ATPase
VSSTTAGVILRALINLQAEGADTFFGEPELNPEDLLRVDAQGRGIITLLELGHQAARPVMFTTFLMWVLPDLFTFLPEVGDLDKPKLVFFFDESHLLFTDASKAFLDQVEQTVKLIRSNGVGVFFCTQLPTDVPNNVLSQLGARIQHALRAFTPDDQAAQDGPHVPEDGRLRPGLGTDGAGNRRSDCHRAFGEGGAYAGRLDGHALAAFADGHHQAGCDRRRGKGQPAAARTRSDHRPRIGLRDA